jgi:hypothetical protein
MLGNVVDFLQLTYPQKDKVSIPVHSSNGI